MHQHLNTTIHSPIMALFLFRFNAACLTLTLSVQATTVMFRKERVKAQSPIPASERGMSSLQGHLATHKQINLTTVLSGSGIFFTNCSLRLSEVSFTCDKKPRCFWTLLNKHANSHGFFTCVFHLCSQPKKQLHCTRVPRTIFDIEILDEHNHSFCVFPEVLFKKFYLAAISNSNCFALPMDPGPEAYNMYDDTLCRRVLNVIEIWFCVLGTSCNQRY